MLGHFRSDIFDVLLLCLCLVWHSGHKVKILHRFAIKPHLFGIGFHPGILDFAVSVLGFDRLNGNGQNDVRHLLEQCRNKLIVQLLRILGNRHALGIGIVNLDVVFEKAHCIRRNGIPKILSQSGAVVKIKLEVRFLSDAEKVVQHFQPGVVIQRTDFAANVGQLAQHIPLHLIQPFAGIFAVLLVGGENQILLLFHIADFFGVGFHQAIAFNAVCVKAIVGAVVQHISLKGNLIHALADNAKLRPAVGRNIRINPAHLC